MATLESRGAAGAGHGLKVWKGNDELKTAGCYALFSSHVYCAASVPENSRGVTAKTA